jgi:hypothetical protein
MAEEIRAGAFSDRVAPLAEVRGGVAVEAVQVFRGHGRALATRSSSRRGSRWAGLGHIRSRITAPDVRRDGSDRENLSLRRTETLRHSHMRRVARPNALTWGGSGEPGAGWISAPPQGTRARPNELLLGGSCGRHPPRLGPSMIPCPHLRATSRWRESLGKTSGE